MLKFSSGQEYAVDASVVAMEKTLKEVYWLMNLCSSLLRDDKHGVLQPIAKPKTSNTDIT